MRIALFTDTFAPQINGVARTIARLAQHLVDTGHNVAIISPDTGPDDDSDVKTLRLRMPGARLPFYPELRIARMLDRKSATQLEAFSPDVVHVATEFTMGWSGVLWAGEHGVPLVSSFHTDFPAYLSAYGARGLEPAAWHYLRAFHARAAVTLCPSGQTLDQLRSHDFDGDLRVWPRGVNTALFNKNTNEEMRRRIRGDAEVALLYVGRVGVEKRIDMLLHAFRKLREIHGRRISLSIVGDGPAMKTVQEDAGEGVQFLGYLKGRDLAAAYAAADIFAFPSDTETFGNVVLEAAASGLAIVAADKGGVTETVRHEQTGLTFRSADTEDLTFQLNRLIADPTLRASVARAASTYARQQSWNDILERVVDVYRETAQRQSAAIDLAS